MNSVENTNKDYFECFSFGDSPEMADELLALVLTFSYYAKPRLKENISFRKEKRNGFGFLGGRADAKHR